MNDGAIAFSESREIKKERTTLVERKGEVEELPKEASGISSGQ